MNNSLDTDRELASLSIPQLIERLSRLTENYSAAVERITNETCKNWGPICKMTGRRVCDACCYRCEHRVSWSGIWRCSYITEEERREQARQRAQERFASESAKISEAYMKRKRERARERAAKAAKARKK